MGRLAEGHPVCIDEQRSRPSLGNFATSFAAAVGERSLGAGRPVAKAGTSSQHRSAADARRHRFSLVRAASRDSIQTGPGSNARKSRISRSRAASDGVDYGNTSLGTRLDQEEDSTVESSDRTTNRTTGDSSERSSQRPSHLGRGSSRGSAFSLSGVGPEKTDKGSIVEEHVRTDFIPEGSVPMHEEGDETAADATPATGRPQPGRAVLERDELPTPRPYEVVMIGVMVDVATAVERGFRRHVITGRSVPLRPQLRSHRLFARNFSALLPLVDQAILVESLEHNNLKVVVQKGGPTEALRVHDDDAWARLQRQAQRLNENATHPDELFFEAPDS